MITSDDWAFFFSYVFSGGFGHHKRGAEKNSRIGTDKAEALEEKFSAADSGGLVDDVGDWTTEIVNKAGYKFKLQ